MNKNDLKNVALAVGGTYVGAKVPSKPNFGPKIPVAPKRNSGVLITPKTKYLSVETMLDAIEEKVAPKLRLGKVTTDWFNAKKAKLPNGKVKSDTLIGCNFYASFSESDNVLLFISHPNGATDVYIAPKEVKHKSYRAIESASNEGFELDVDTRHLTTFCTDLIYYMKNSSITE